MTFSSCLGRQPLGPLDSGTGALYGGPSIGMVTIGSIHNQVTGLNSSTSNWQAVARDTAGAGLPIRCLTNVAGKLRLAMPNLTACRSAPFV